MTDIEILESLKSYTSKPEVIDRAIAALRQEPCEELDFVQPHKKLSVNLNITEPCDAVSRKAAIDLADELKDDLPDDDRLSDMIMSHNEGVLEYQTKLSLLPSVTPAEKTLQFAEWVATEIFDDMWEYNKDAFAEIACRKLAKLGIVKAKGDVWELQGLKEQKNNHEQALEAAKVIRDYCDSFPLMSCKGCVFDRSTGCTLKNPCDFPETWELEGGKMEKTLEDNCEFTFDSGGISQEDWDRLTDANYEHTERIFVKAKNGNEVEFVKLHKGHWYKKPHEICYTCDQCRTTNASGTKYNFCPHCGACMQEGGEG